MEEQEEIRKERNPRAALYRRWIYMAVAVLASVLMSFKPVFNFQDDKGIIYVRSYHMTQTTFTVVQTELDTNIPHITASMSVRGLLYCRLAMLAGAVLCLLCFFNDRWRLFLCTFTTACAGAYYIIMIYYAIQLVDEYYVTLYPNFMALMPAIVLEMMVLTRMSVVKTVREEEEQANEEELE